MLKVNKAPKEKDESLIPSGRYCHASGEPEPYCVEHPPRPRYLCPYWDFDDEKPYQENGYCHFMEKGDWTIAEENPSFCSYSKDHPEDVGKMCHGFSLIWDKCKECGIKLDEDSD
jgi:hypothetical protein